LRKPLVMAAALLFIFMVSGVLHPSPAGDGSTYFYGYAPSTARETFGIGAGYAYLDIIGVNDSTRVSIYDLRTGVQLDEATVNRMQLYTYRLSSGTYFKVEADKMVSVCLSSGAIIMGAISALGPPTAETFYTSIDGGFAGKEFIFMALETFQNQISIYAVEDSQVTIYNSTGSTVHQLNLNAYSQGGIQLRARAVYRLVSTGRVTVENAPNWAPSLTYAPSLTGGFTGNTFSMFFGYFHPQEMYPLTITAQERSTVKVFGIAPGGVSTTPTHEVSLEAGESRTFSVRTALPEVVQATGRVLVWEGPGGSLTFMGLRAGEDAWLQVPDGGGIIFSPNPTSLTIDDAPRTLGRDGMEPIPPGLHHITTNATIVLELFAASMEQYAAYLVSPQGLEIVYPAPPPIPAAGDMTIYYAAAGAAVAVVAVALVLRRRGGRRVS